MSSWIDVQKRHSFLCCITFCELIKSIFRITYVSEHVCIVTHRLSGSGSSQREAGSGTINAQSGGVASSHQLTGVNAGVINMSVYNYQPNGKIFSVINMKKFPLIICLNVTTEMSLIILH